MKEIGENAGKFKKIDFQTKFKTYEDFQNHLQINGPKIDDPQDFYNFMNSQENNLVMSEEDSMIRSMELGNKFWLLFLNAHYEVLETRKDNFFLCSDNPFFIIPPSDWPKNIGLGIVEPRTAEKIIPISKKQCLRITIFPEEVTHGISLSYSTVNQKTTNRINQFICKNAERFIVSKEKEYLKKILETIDSKKLADDKNRERVVKSKDFPMAMNYSFYPY